MDVLTLFIILLALGGFCGLGYYVLAHAAKHYPTWTGIILSALLGLLPLYLILCFFGLMGEKR